MTIVVAISSLVMRGAVGLRATQFALERRGAQVWPVPTVVMPWHPGLGESTRTVMLDLPSQLEELASRAEEVDAVLTGYFATAEQVAAAAQLIDTVRRHRSDAVIAVDPIIGDEHGRYVPDAVAEAIIGTLLPRADIATPNAAEVRDLGGDDDVEDAARALGVPSVIVTSAIDTLGRTGAVLVNDSGTVIAEHAAVHPAPRGTGDLFGAVFLSATLAGAGDREALEEAAAATLAVLQRSGPEAMAIVAAQDAIADPPRGLVTLATP